MAFETFAFCSSLPYKKLLPNIQARVSCYFSNTPSNSASRHVIPIQDLLFFLNFHQGLGETWIIRWTFNVHENQPQWTEGSLPSCMWHAQRNNIWRYAKYMQTNPKRWRERYRSQIQQPLKLWNLFEVILLIYNETKFHDTQKYKSI